MDLEYGLGEEKRALFSCNLGKGKIVVIFVSAEQGETFRKAIYKEGNVQRSTGINARTSVVTQIFGVVLLFWIII